MDRNEYKDRRGELNQAVALRKESVDRNNEWFATVQGLLDVALRKESVDRNSASLLQSLGGNSRSPQGERG